VLSVLFHDIAKPATQTVDENGRIRFNGHDMVGARMTDHILHRLKYPNDVIEQTVEAVAESHGLQGRAKNARGQAEALYGAARI